MVQLALLLAASHPFDDESDVREPLISAKPRLSAAEDDVNLYAVVGEPETW